MNSKDQISQTKYALYLAYFTIVYNILEGIVSILFGISDGSLSLFGFGLDSFVETISAIGIAHMIYRMKQNPLVEKGDFEKTALKITGICFYGLAIILVISAVLDIINHKKPTSTFPGIIISCISILIMIILIIEKRKVGRALKSAPILADANCSLVCVYMSLVLLGASILYEIFKIPWFDILGAAGIIYFCIREGREALLEAKGKSNCSCNQCEIK